jgi:hypothetical protein
MGGSVSRGNGIVAIDRVYLGRPVTAGRPKELGSDIVFESIDTCNQAVMIECGHADCVFMSMGETCRGVHPRLTTTSTR